MSQNPKEFLLFISPTGACLPDCFKKKFKKIVEKKIAQVAINKHAIYSVYLCICKQSQRQKLRLHDKGFCTMLHLTCN
jgi:hypothetical protein